VQGFYSRFARKETALRRSGVSFSHGSHPAIPRSKEAQMKARILVVTVVGSLVLAASPAYGSVILPDGGAPVSVHRAPTAIAHHLVKPPWQAPNHNQVSRNSI
jgi:hypothetical protein